MTKPRKDANSVPSTTYARPVKRRYLPSIGSLATFEVAAKYLSFTLAASELHVTQAAVSQQIRSLEKAVGSQLFIRKHNSMELTQQGRLLLAAVTQGLDKLSQAMVELSEADEETQTVTLSGTYASVSEFLKPLVDEYYELAPQVRFTMLASDENDKLSSFEEVDIALICGNERAAVDDHLVPLFDEVVDPVCAPSYLNRVGPIKTAEKILKQDLMELHRMHWTSDAIGWQPIEWRNWAQQFAPHMPDPECKFHTNCYRTLIQSTVDGKGIILGWRHLVLSKIVKGELIRVIDRPVATGRSYFLKLNPATREKPAVKEFMNFLEARLIAQKSLL